MQIQQPRMPLGGTTSIPPNWPELTATLVLALICVLVLTKFVDHLADRQLTRMEARGEDTASIKTRYAMLKRVTIAIVLTIAVGAFLLQFPATQQFAQLALASSAVIALIVGLAIQTPLGNAGAGVFMAFSQPFRIGDVISAGGETGEVVEIRLSYTVLRTPDNRRVFAPNSALISQPIANATIEDRRRRVVVSVPVHARADIEAVLAALVEEAAALPDALESPAPTATVAAIAPGLVTLEITCWAGDGAGALRLGAALRLAALRRLRALDALALEAAGA